ncbi:MAG: AmmeMemoRadiSam system protein A [Desulfomonilia bacterium]
MVFTQTEKHWLVGIARRSIQAVLAGGSPLDRMIDEARISPVLTQKKAVCVSLYQNDELRGCTGYLMSLVPLWRAVQENARNAAFRDPRFQPLRYDELPHVEVVIHVISHTVPVSAEEEFDPGAEGLLLRKGSRTALFLPRPWITGTLTRCEIISRLCREAVLGPEGFSGAEDKKIVFIDAIIRDESRTEAQSPR